MKISILGGTGFIGKAVSKVLESTGYDTRIVSRSDSIFQQEIKRIETETHIIINLAGAWRDCTDAEMLDANFEFPSGILDREIESKKTLIWIQASSYFQLYFEFYGVDKNFYSKTKRQFSEKLEQDVARNKNLQVLDFFLPHITGPGEPSFRLFPSLASSVSNGSILDLSSGTAVMPILDIRNLSNLIEVTISEIGTSFSPSYTKIYPEVTELVNLRSLVGLLFDNPAQHCRFGKLRDRENEFTEIELLKQFYKVNPSYISLPDSFLDQIKACEKKPKF